MPSTYDGDYSDYSRLYEKDVAELADVVVQHLSKATPLSRGISTLSLLCIGEADEPIREDGSSFASVDCQCFVVGTSRDMFGQRRATATRVDRWQVQYIEPTWKVMHPVTGEDCGLGWLRSYDSD